MTWRKLEIISRWKFQGLQITWFNLMICRCWVTIYSSSSFAVIIRVFRSTMSNSLWSKCLKAFTIYTPNAKSFTPTSSLRTFWFVSTRVMWEKSLPMPLITTKWALKCQARLSPLLPRDSGKSTWPQRCPKWVKKIAEYSNVSQQSVHVRQEARPLKVNLLSLTTIRFSAKRARKAGSAPTKSKFAEPYNHTFLSKACA